MVYLLAAVMCDTGLQNSQTYKTAKPKFATYPSDFPWTAPVSVHTVDPVLWADLRSEHRATGLHKRLKTVVWIQWNLETNVICIPSTSLLLFWLLRCPSSPLQAPRASLQNKRPLWSKDPDRFQPKKRAPTQTVCLFCIAMTMSDKRSKNIKG